MHHLSLKKFSEGQNDFVISEEKEEHSRSSQKNTKPRTRECQRLAPRTASNFF